MTADGHGTPQDRAHEAARPAADAVGSDDLKTRAQGKAVQAKDTVTGQAGNAVHATREKVGQAKDAAAQKAGDAVHAGREKVGQAKEKVSDLASPEGPAPAITSPPAVRGAGAGVVTLGLATALVVWLLRRRARRNANPWQVAARTAKSQIKTVRKQAKSGLKATRERSREEAASQVAAAKAKARKARAKAKAKSWN